MFYFTRPEASRAVEALLSKAVNHARPECVSRLLSAVRRAYRKAPNREGPVRLKDELWQRDELLRQITEHVEDLIEVLDPQGHRLFVSPACTRLFGEQRTRIGRYEED